jgi:predicted ATPase
MITVLGRPAALEKFPSLGDDSSREVVRLGPLPERAAAEAVRAICGEAIADRIVESIVERAAGNPRLVYELARDAAMGTDERVLSPAVLALAQDRLDSLAARDRVVARAASVFEGPFSPSGIAAVLGESSDARVMGAIERLIAAGVVQAVPASSPTYAFCEPFVREALYATIVEQDATLAHHRAMKWGASGGRD